MITRRGGLGDQSERSVDLLPGQGFVVPKGVTHCTRAPEPSVILMVETAACGHAPFLKKKPQPSVHSDGRYDPSTFFGIAPPLDFLILKKRKPIHRQILKFSETETRISIN